MLVVADSSPLIVLINIGLIDILPDLFGKVIIPPEVATELAQDKRPQPVRAFIAAPPDWLIEQAPATVEAIPMLHPGEASAISLALEVHADLLLIDEMLGRKAAALRGLHITGTIGVLEQAADQGLLDLNEAFTRIKNSDFWIAPELLNARLKIYLDRKSDTSYEIGPLETAYRAVSECSSVEPYPDEIPDSAFDLA
jgi:predicted nucleic acid-binding protein